MAQVVLGGGVSGLSAAYYLSKLGQTGIKVYEASNRVGGWINSIRTKNGTLFELGPRTLQCVGEKSDNTLNLSEEIGLMPSIIHLPNTHPVAKNRKICYNNQLVSLPTTFSSFFRIKPPYMRPLIAAFWKDFTTQKKPLDDDSVYNFMARRFGEDYAELPGSAMVCGIFGGDSKEISVKAVMQEIFQFEQKYGSVVQGVFKGPRKKLSKYRQETVSWSVWSYQDGLETLPAKLKMSLEEDNKAKVFLEKKCSKIVFDKNTAILTIDGEEEIAEHVYSCIPSRELAKILVQHPFLKTELSSIPFVSMAVVNLAYDANLIKDKSFGFLVPPNQNLPILGVVYDTCIFPQEGKTVLTVMMGGKWFEKYLGPNPDDDFLYQTAKDQVQRLLKINDDPTDSKVTVLKNCLPQYIVGHSNTVNRIREYITKNQLPLTLIGNSFDGVGVHDAIMSAKTNLSNVSVYKGSLLNK